MAQNDCGVPFTAAASNLTVATSSQELIQITASSTTPILIQRLVASAGVTASTILIVQLANLTAAGSGGTSVTPYSTQAGAGTGNSSLTANTTVSYGNTTTGTLGHLIDAQQWNEFAPYEFNQKPGGLFVPPSGIVSLHLGTAPGATFPASFTVEFIEFR